MSIVTISRSFCTQGNIVAEKVAQKLGYECVSFEILLEASKQFNIPETTLSKAIHDGPSVYDRLTHGKERYIGFIQAALLNHLKKGNIIYHGLAGHFFVQNVPHVLKVRLLADMDTRVEEEMRRENVHEAVARERITKDDKDRCNWSSYLYKIDTRDPELYDLTINLSHISIEDCVTIICETLKTPYFAKSQKAKVQLQDMALSATVKAAIIDGYYTAEVTSQEGNVIIKLPEPITNVNKTKEEIRTLTEDIQGINDIYFNIKSNALPRTAMHK